MRLVDEAALPDLVARVRPLADLYVKSAPDIRDMVHRWVTSPSTWCLGVYWRDAPLQYETYHFRGPGAPREIMGGFNTHIDRERPHWFYREVGRPILEALVRLGVRSVHSYIRADRPDFAQYLAATHGHTIHGLAPNGRTIHVSCDPRQALAACTGWPARRTAQPVTRGRLTVSACGVDEALALLPGLWIGASPTRARLAERLLHERYWLDCGTLAVGTESGVPKALWVTRDNVLGGPECAHTTLSPWAAAPRLLHKLILEWELALGYTTAASVWEAWMWDLPRSRALVPWRERRRSVHRGAEFVSTELTLADAVAIPDTAWA